MFPTDLLSIIVSLKTLYTAISICKAEILMWVNFLMYIHAFCR